MDEIKLEIDKLDQNSKDYIFNAMKKWNYDTLKSCKTIVLRKIENIKDTKPLDIIIEKLKYLIDNEPIDSKWNNQIGDLQIKLKNLENRLSDDKFYKMIK